MEDWPMPCPARRCCWTPKRRPSDRPGSCPASGPTSRPPACWPCGLRSPSSCAPSSATARTSSPTPPGSASPAGPTPPPPPPPLPALSLRDGGLADALPRETLLLDPEAPAERSAWFLPGIRAHEQAPSLLALWDPLTEQLRALERNGQDVIVDAGRLGLAGWPQPLIAASDLTLLVTRSSLPALAGATSWAKTLRGQFGAVGGLSRLGVLLVDEERRWPTVPTGARVRPYTARHIRSEEHTSELQ